jgi:hypothetical protein
MVERSPILSAKNDNQEIGYVEGVAAYDLLGNKRCNYNPSTGNLLELDSGRTIGHVSLAGHFLGLSWIADELFPPPRRQLRRTKRRLTLRRRRFIGRSRNTTRP